MRRGAGIFGLGLLSGCFFLYAAGVGQQTPAVRQPVPEQELILMLFRSVAPPDVGGEPQLPARVSAAMMAKYQSAANLTDAQVRILKEAAEACVRQVSPIDQKARAIALAAREQAKEQARQTGIIPPPPPILAELQKQRNDIVTDSVNRLREALGAEAYQRLAYALSHQNVNERGEDRASFSVSLPPDLAKPAPPEARIERPDFKMPRESLYESKLPVKIMITPVGPDGVAEKPDYHAGEDVYLKVTLLNTVRERQVLRVAEVLSNYKVSTTKNGEKIPDLMYVGTLDLVPSCAASPVVDIPFDVPLVIGTIRLDRDTRFDRNPRFDLTEGKYTFVLQRSFALRPTINEEEEALYREIGHFALKSNTVAITIHP